MAVRRRFASGPSRDSPSTAQETRKTQRIRCGVYAATSKNHPTAVVGTSNDYLGVHGLELTRGRAFDRREEAGVPACIIGSSLRDALFKLGDPLGKTLRLGSLT
jgi:hypothetical protein